MFEGDTITIIKGHKKCDPIISDRIAFFRFSPFHNNRYYTQKVGIKPRNLCFTATDKEKVFLEVLKKLFTALILYFLQADYRNSGR